MLQKVESWLAVPELTGVFIELLKRITGQKPLIVDHALKLGIRIETDFPEKVGHDRIANAVAAYHSIGLH